MEGTGVGADAGLPNYLAATVDRAGNVLGRASKIAEVRDAFLFPENAVKRGEFTVSGDAEDLTSGVDEHRPSVGVTRNCREFVSLPIRPDDGPILQNLWRYTGRVSMVSFRSPDHLATRIDPMPTTVIAAQRGQRSHNALSPNEGNTYEVSGTAELFGQRIRSQRLRNAGDSATLVNGKSRAVRTSQRAEVDHHAVLPQKAMSAAVRQARKSNYLASIVQSESPAKSSAKRTQVFDSVARLLCKQLERNRKSKSKY